MSEARAAPDRPSEAAAEADALAAHSRGDFRAATAALMRLYGPAIYRFCLEQTRDAPAAEDLLQAVFIQAHQALPRYVPRTSLRAWLYGIARHRCLDAVSSRRRWARVVEPEGERPDLPEVPDGAAGGDAHVAALEHRAALDGCLEKLPPRVRETLLLRFRADLSYNEMSEACGEQPGTLRVRVLRALPLLRRCLEEKGVEP